MKKLEITIPQSSAGWGNTNTKYPADSIFVSADDFTGNTKNTDTNTKGVITKRLGTTVYNAVDFGSPPKDQYEAVFSDGAHHLLEVNSGTLKYSSGDTTFTSVTSGYSSNGNFEFAIYLDRVYFGNGINPSQVYDRTASYGGVTYSVPRTKNAGAQSPGSAPTFAADSAGGNVPAGGHTYKITFLYYDFEESNGGPTSTLHTVTNPNNTVNLTAIPIGGYGVTARNIYRDNDDGVWLLVGEIFDNTTTIFVDTASIGTAPIPTDNNVPPQFSLVVEHLDRLWGAGVAGSPSTLFYSQAGLPDIWGSDTELTCNPRDPITALVVFNDKVWVFNRNSIGQILGRRQEEFRYSEVPGNVGCVDNRSIQIRTIEGVPILIWLSDKGIYGTNGSSISYLSDSIEDLVNFNIQQAQQIKGRNTQSTQADFEGGTASAGIDLLSDPGFITTENPKHLWQSHNDWNGGSVNNNTVTELGDNLLKTPVIFRPDLTQGTAYGDMLISFGPKLAFPLSAYPESGSWLSAVYDTGSPSGAIPTTVHQDSSWPVFQPSSFDTLTTIVEGSSDPSFTLGPETSQTIVGLNGDAVLSLSGKRYWRVRVTASTPFNAPPDRNFFVENIVLTFQNTSTWISEAIDTTSDSTVYNSLTLNSTTPIGTSIFMTIATSPDNITYTSFVPFGTEVVQRYAKIQLVLTATSDDTVTPFVTSLVFTWTIVANLISSAIDTATTPAGWDIFQSTFITNDGTVQFQMRSASTSFGLSLATFFTVTNGDFPPSGVTPLQFVQWKVIITSTADAIPTIKSVTINWFLTSISSVRAASIFYNKYYALAAAELGQSKNNVIILYDQNGRWRIYRGLSINTFSLFFNEPYFGDANLGQIFKFLQGTSDNGTTIELNVETKAFNFGRDDKTKILRKIYVTGLNTGASYTFYYSIDRGTTWILLQDATLGTTTIVTTSDLSRFVKRLTPPFSTLQEGKTINIRVNSNDLNAVQLHQFVIDAWVREGELINV